MSTGLTDDNLDPLLAVATVSFLCLGYGAQAAADGEWSGFVSGEVWYFPNTSPLQPDLYQTDLSVAVQPE